MLFIASQRGCMSSLTKDSSAYRCRDTAENMILTMVNKQPVVNFFDEFWLTAAHRLIQCMVYRRFWNTILKRHPKQTVKATEGHDA